MKAEALRQFAASRPRNEQGSSFSQMPLLIAASVDEPKLLTTSQRATIAVEMEPIFTKEAEQMKAEAARKQALAQVRNEQGSSFSRLVPEVGPTVTPSQRATAAVEMEPLFADGGSLSG